MAWFMRGVQSALFHYASCAPCTGYSDSRKRRKAAKEARKLREKLELEQPGAYYHPEPTGTNAYWSEEIAMGPGPPPRRSRKTNTTQRTGSRGLPTRGTQSSTLSKGGSSLDVDHAAENRLSDDTLDDDDETWNHKRYQREDEDLWGYDDHSTALEHTMTGSSVGGGGYQLQRPNVSRAGSYYVARVPPVNELHPPVVSLPSPDPSENRWMLQPPPKASVMAGKERAKNRSRSGSGASSRVELSLGRQVSTRQLMQKLERGQTPDRLTNSPNGSHSNLAHGRCKTPQARPLSATSSSPNRKRRDTAMARDLAIARTDTASTQHSSQDPSDITVRGSSTLSVDVQVLRTHQSRPVLSTVASSNSGQDENALPEKPKPVYRNSTTSDLSSLSCLQDLVSPQALLTSRFVSAPLVEAKIRLPPSEEDMAARARKDKISQIKKDDDEVDAIINVPFDRESGPPEKDPAFRWSVDF
ncbi:hypothetical protein COCCADRAFT_99064 [Bipolaris zeicola 26-R-13]|uniref:Uncharacterized protein n=1 Tax=Cochliobolus carbonum (strain 26-R-13) TaxID=930089 RepID=W6YA30_COCC2|nr:uncharacterized protein COCCADRAFT_99064 [Bipolaris zeicola 26-R-13]EUC32294.1 hypothetical protein COCCADRAFT_99064 [Bipolaris zeicola 26-R-13]